MKVLACLCGHSATFGKGAAIGGAHGWVCLGIAFRGGKDSFCVKSALTVAFQQTNIGVFDKALFVFALNEPVIVALAKLALEGCCYCAMAYNHYVFVALNVFFKEAMGAFGHIIQAFAAGWAGIDIAFLLTLFAVSCEFLRQ